MNKISKFLICLIALCFTCFCVNAQVVTQSRALSEFDKIDASYDFNIKFVKGMTYSVEWTTDTDLVNFWELYVRKNVLYVNMSKEGQKFIKKNYKKDNKPCLNVTISLPVLNELNIKDNVVVLDGLDPIICKNFTLKAEDKAQVLNLNLNLQEGKAKLDIEDHAKVQLAIDAYEINANVENSATLILNQKCVKLNISSEDRATLNINGESKNVDINSKNSAKINLVGNGENLVCKAKNSSEISAEGFIVDKANVELYGATCIVNSTKALDINIESGAVLVYNGTPTINIKKIEKSSVLLFNNYKK